MSSLSNEKTNKRNKGEILVLFLKMILLGIVVQVIAAYVLTFFLNMMPDVANDYSEGISRLVELTPGIMLYTCVLSPVLEELVFRGFILNISARFIPFIAANIIQAALFGIYHGNIVQGIYAFILGLFIGWMMKVAGNVLYTMVLHMSINLMGVLISYLSFDDANIVIKIFVMLTSVVIGTLVVRSISVKSKDTER